MVFKFAHTHDTTTNEEVKKIHAKMSKGDAPITDSSGLQQVLIYGKTAGGVLHPLESVGDRLKCDTELASGWGQFSGGGMTQASTIQVVGATGNSNGSSKMRTLKVDDFGHLITQNPDSVFGSPVVVMDDRAIASSSFSTTDSIQLKRGDKLMLAFNCNNGGGGFEVIFQESLDNAYFFDGADRAAGLESGLIEHTVRVPYTKIKVNNTTADTLNFDLKYV
jgi:hypothetical protein